MPRTNTTSLTKFTRQGHVTYNLPSPSSTSTVVTITLPPNSTWTSGAHWHETHTEYLQVVKGSAQITLNGQTRLYGPRDGKVTVPAYAVHEWGRAPPRFDFDGGDFGGVQDVVVREWTDPADGLKEVFFRNLSSVILDETRQGPPESEWWLSLQLWVVFYGLDNWPVFVSFGPPWLRWFVTHLLLRAAVSLGRYWGLKSVYEEYTPQTLAKGAEVRKKET